MTRLLKLYDGYPLGHWPYALSINAAVSIFVVVLKVAVSLIAAEGMGAEALAHYPAHILLGVNQLKWTFYLRPQRLYMIERF